MVPKITESRYIFFKKSQLFKSEQNPIFPLTQCCFKPEKATPGSTDQE